MRTPHLTRLLLAVACLTVTAACGSGPKAARGTAGSAPITGAFGRSGETREFQRAAVFAAREESKRVGMPIRVVEVLDGKTQVVAGTNFRLRVGAQRNGASTETAEIVVFRDLGGRFHLTSWRWARR